ncbi:MAG: type III pantothenate kinase [Synechococcaceae cyanobacterium]|nr:type III pantothenate kinase [Synechococcaceae cyanobacterium]
MAGGGGRWLLIGNSRWHWAEAHGQGLRRWDGPPHGPDPLPALTGWAAVGPLPDPCPLPPRSRLALEEVPLADAPTWLGIDRALAGWLAWRRCGGPVLVADAGTVLSLTRVDARGRFRGGRLMAGLALQLRAMGSAAHALPSSLEAQGSPGGETPGDPWPRATARAMREGVRRGLAAVVAAAAAEAVAADPLCRLVLTGGDGEELAGLLAQASAMAVIPWEHRPALCLEALAQLRPAPDPPGSGRPSPRPSP